MLSSLRIQNYKSLHDVNLDLPAFVTVVGANAAGKSNFADAIEFLAILARSGLAAALNEKGGYENICFRRQRRSKGAIVLRCALSGIKEGRSTFDFTMSLSFRAQKEAIRSGYLVESEHLVVAIKTDSRSEPYLEINRRKSDVKVQVNKEHRSMGLLPSAEFFEGIFERMKGKALLREDDLLLWTYLRGLPPFDRILGEMSRFRVFQLSPTEARKAGATSGSQELGKHGDNLPAVLDWLKREQPLGFDRLLNYARQAVPTIDAIETDYTDTREMGLYLRERGIQRRLFASELSDGTVRTLAMFLPLIDPRVRLAVIEEPENSIHPWVVREFVEACRLCSANKQIILTTHSPVLVSKLEPHELYVAERARGETAILQATRANVELEQVIRKGIQDLGSYWDSGAMQAVPGDPQGLLEFMDSDGKGR